MGLFDMVRGQLIDVIEWTDDSGDTLVHKYDMNGKEIMMGAQLTVRESQAAVFVDEGRLADVFGPGRYELTTRNLPVMTALRAWKFGFNSPFKSDVYFVSTRQFMDRKWGTANPVMMRDSEFGMIRVRAFGSFSFRVKDPAAFMREVFGTSSLFTAEGVEGQIRSLAVSALSDAIAESGIPALDLASKYDELSRRALETLAPRVEGLGLPGDRLSEAETVAEHSDVVVLVTGLNENLEGEEMDQSNSVGSGDKANLLLPAPQRKLMEIVAKTGKPVILINMTGSAMDLRFAEENFSAVVQGWYPGARGGKAIAELLFGKYSFSGKLPVTFYNDSDELPAFTDYAMENRTYRYFTGGVLYPFGYGLTYGKTEVTKAEMRDDGEHYTITATVKNEGCAVHEILQVYVRDNESEFAVRNHSLCAFKAVSLGANETCDVEITVPKAALEIVDDTGTRRVDSRSFTFFVGTSQPDDRSAELLGTRPVAVELKL